MREGEKMSAECEGGVPSGSLGRVDQGLEARTSRERLARPQKKHSVVDLNHCGPSLACTSRCTQSHSETHNGTGNSVGKGGPTDIPGAMLMEENPPAASISNEASACMCFSVPHGSGTFPLPLFLVQLWLLDWERQQRLSQATCPLPLHNPSSFCFFSASLHALASLHSVVDLAHNLAFLRLLQRNLALDNSVARNKQLRACARPSDGPDGFAPHHTAACGVSNQALPRRRGRPLKSCALEALGECFPLSLYRCLLALNRGRVKGSFFRTLPSYAVCACTGLSGSDHLGRSEESSTHTVESGYFQGYGGSLLSLLHELATETVIYPAEETHAGEEKSGQVTSALAYSERSRGGSTRLLTDVAEAGRRQGDRLGKNDSLHRYSGEIKLSWDAKDSPNDSNVVDEVTKVRDHCSIVGSAVQSSVQALEDEWHLSRALTNDASSAQRSKVVSMYRELMGTLQSSAGSSGNHGAFGSLLEDASSLRERHIRSQDTHEFLQLLIEQTQKECETAGRLQEALKAYLERSSEQNTEICAHPRVLRSLPGRRHTSNFDTRECREPMGCAATTPTEEASASLPSNATTDANASGIHLVSGGGADGSVQSSQFVSCHGSLWSLIPQNNLKSVFVGTLQESLRCLRCGVCSPERSTPFWCLHVTLTEECSSETTSSLRKSSSVTLERLLDVALGPQRVDDVECTSCSVSATLACLRDRLEASPLLAAARMHGNGGPSHFKTVKTLHSAEAFGHMESSSKDGCNVKSEETQLQLYCEDQERARPSTPSLRDYQGSTVCQCRRAGLTEQDVAARDHHTVEGFGVEIVSPHLDEVPGLFSTFWYLPASVVSAWVRIWRLVFRLRRYLILRGVARSSACNRQSTRVLTGTERSACQQRISYAAPAGVVGARGDAMRSTETRTAGSDQHTRLPARQIARPCGPSSSAGSTCIPETDEELRSAAGDLWVVELSPKEKLQRVEHLPSVLIIQVNALKLRHSGQVCKEQKHCVSPFLLDATFMTRSTATEEEIKFGKQAGFSAAWFHAANDEGEHFTCGSKNNQRDMCGNTKVCTTSTSVGAAVSGDYGFVGRAPPTMNATAVSDPHRQCWCGLYHLYELRAVITHTGTTSDGHFACYRRWDAHAFIPGAAWSLFLRQFLSGISPATQNGSEPDRVNRENINAEGFIAENHSECSQRTGGWCQLRHRVRQWLLHAARIGCARSSFAWISDDCVRPASFAEVQAAQPYLLFYEKVSPSVF